MFQRYYPAMRLVMMALLFTLPAIGGPEAHKSQVRDLITAHLQGHPECESRQILPVLGDVEIVEAFHINPDVSGWVHEGKIFINTNKKCKWTDRKIALFLIHELIHTCGMCMNDSIRSYDKNKPICVIFGRKIYHSMELTEAIKKHFRETEGENAGR